MPDDIELIRDLRARLEAAERERDDLRAALDLASEGVDAHDASRRGAARLRSR